MKAFRSILSLLLALIMVVSMIPATFATAEDDTQEEFVPTDPYVYHYEVENDGYEGPRYQYFSPYYASHYYDGEIRGDNIIFSYSMYNTLTGQVVPTYSADIFTGIYSGNRYRLVDLNTSSLTRSVAEKLLSVMTNGFYLSPATGESDEAYAIRAEEKLASIREAVGISDLTPGEVVAATQMAVWRTVHGEKLTFDPMVRNVFTVQKEELFRYYDLFNEERENGHYALGTDGKITEESKAYIASRIETIYDYLLALEPTNERRKLLSEESFAGAHEYSSMRNADGTYDIEINVITDIDLREEDSLTVTAMVDPTHYAQAPVTYSHGQYTLCIRNVPEESLYDEKGQLKKITVSIDGTQSLPQVVLFEAECGMDKSDTMIGMDNFQAPVHAEITVELEKLGQYVPRNPYVYTYGIDENEPYRYQYHSPYIAQYSYGDRAGRVSIFGYNLYNSVTQTTVAAYCTDITTNANRFSTYRRQDLAGSSSGIREPGILRAIMQEGFYLSAMAGETDEEYTARAEAKLASLREAVGIEDLTLGEAVAATQLAIWKATHGSELEFTDTVYYVYETTVGPTLFPYYDLYNREIEEGHVTFGAYGNITAESKAYIAARIETLYHYLLGLEPVWETKELVSEESFGGLREKSVVRNIDGTYDISIDAYVKVSLDEGDYLNITAMVDDTHYTKMNLVNGYNELVLTIENVPENLLINEATGKVQPITVAIDGMQSASQVICFEAKGGKTASQSMVAIDEGAVPVHAEMTVNLKSVDVPTPTLKVGRSLNLESNISINYMISAEALADYSDYTLYCYTEREGEPYILKPQVKDSYVYFTFDGFTALNMNDVVDAYLYVTLDGQESVIPVGEYTIATYAYSMMEKTGASDQVKAICANLLRYGAKAQLYKEYQVENLPDTNLTAEQTAYLTDLQSVKFGAPYIILSDLDGAGVAWAGRSMSLESTIAVNLVVDVSDYEGDPTALTLRATYTNVKGEEKSVILDPTPYSDISDLYVFTLAELNAADLRSELVCRVYADNEPVSQTMIYSAGSYGNHKTGALLELCQALFAYVDCARAFFAK